MTTVKTVRRLPRTGSAAAVVPAAPEAVWAVLSDVARIGEWSHEARTATWTTGDPDAIGSVFRGTNRSGLLRWARPCTVLEAAVPSVFSYRTDGGRLYGDNTRWTFCLEAVDGGTRIAVDYEIEKMPRWFEFMIVRLLPGHLDRGPALAGDLERLGAVAATEPATR